MLTFLPIFPTISKMGMSRSCFLLLHFDRFSTISFSETVKKVDINVHLHIFEKSCLYLEVFTVLVKKYQMQKLLHRLELIWKLWYIPISVNHYCALLRVLGKLFWIIDSQWYLNVSYCIFDRKHYWTYVY